MWKWGGNTHVLVVALGGVCIISGDVQDVTSADGDIRIVHRVTGSDLGALGVEGNGKRPAGLFGLGLAGIVNDRLVVLVGAVRKVHADDIQTSSTERVDLLGRVGLGANGADDGCATVLLGGVVLGVELGQPFNPGPAGVEVVESVGHSCERRMAGCGWWG